MKKKLSIIWKMIIKLTELGLALLVFLDVIFGVADMNTAIMIGVLIWHVILDIRSYQQPITINFIDTSGKDSE